MVSKPFRLWQSLHRGSLGAEAWQAEGGGELLLGKVRTSQVVGRKMEMLHALLPT